MCSKFLLAARSKASEGWYGPTILDMGSFSRLTWMCPAFRGESIDMVASHNVRIQRRKHGLEQLTRTDLANYTQNLVQEVTVSELPNHAIYSEQLRHDR